MGYIFVADSMWVALHIFEQFCPKARNANSIVAEPETDFNAKWSFKVIYFGVTINCRSLWTTLSVCGVGSRGVATGGI